MDLVFVVFGFSGQTNSIFRLSLVSLNDLGTMLLLLRVAIRSAEL
jgi:hypothetical protein